MLRAARPGGLARYPEQPDSSEEIPLATEIDPVCGMEVDSATSLLSHEHDGTTYWFCGKGCLLEFKDDPARYLDPEYVPAM